MAATRFAELTGVSRERLRTWERRFGFPRPVRVAGGPRRYRVADLARVVAVRRAAADGAPLGVAIEESAGIVAPGAPAPPPEVFQAAVELVPVPVALVSGPAPLRLEWANAALRAVPDSPAPGAALDAWEQAGAGALVREQFATDRQPVETEHPRWDGAAGPPARSIVYRLPDRPGDRPVVAVVGVETRAERRAQAALADRDDELQRLRRRTERHDRWLDALAALGEAFQHEPGPDVVGSALDVLIRQTRAVDAGLATYLSGRLLLRGSRRSVLGAEGLTVAAHPQVGRALRDAEGVWLDATAAGVLGVPRGLHAVGIPVAVAGETLGMLVMVFDEVEPHDADNRRLLAAISAAVGFALLRDRLVEELRATVGAPAPTRFERPAAGA